MPQPQPSKTQPDTTMQNPAIIPFQCLLSAKGSFCVEAKIDAGYRQDLSQMALLWLKENHRGAQRHGIYHQQEASPEAYESDGNTSSVSKTKNLKSSSSASSIPLLAEKCDHHASKSCLEQRHYLCSHEKRLLLSCRCHGLVLKVCIRMEDLKFSRRHLLYRCSRGCFSLRKTRDLQQRPRMSIHKSIFSQPAAKQRYSHQYGRKRTLHRQCLDRTIVEKHQIQRPIHSGVFRRKSPIQRHQKLFQVLQFPTPASSVILQNTRRDISANMIRSMHTNVLWIASKNLSTVLGKRREFSTVNTDPTTKYIYQIFILTLPNFWVLLPSSVVETPSLLNQMLIRSSSA